MPETPLNPDINDIYDELMHLFGLMTDYTQAKITGAEHMVEFLRPYIHNRIASITAGYAHIEKRIGSLEEEVKRLQTMINKLHAENTFLYNNAYPPVDGNDLVH